MYVNFLFISLKPNHTNELVSKLIVAVVYQMYFVQVMHFTLKTENFNGTPESSYTTHTKPLMQFQFTLVFTWK